MEQITKLVNFYKEGFTLANKNYQLYLIEFLLILPILKFFLPKPVSNNGLLSILTSIELFISIGFSLSIPYFLTIKKKNELLSFKQIWSTTIQNIKRIILPGIVIYLLLLLLLIGSTLFIAIYLHPSRQGIVAWIQSLSTIGQGWNPIFLIPPFIIALFTFSSILFSIEKKGLIRSFIISTQISIKNLSFYSSVVLIQIISYSLGSFIPSNQFLGEFIKLAMNCYIGFIIISTSIYYYQKSSK